MNMVAELEQEGVMTERIAKLKASIIDTPVVHDSERLKFLMEVYKETDGEPTIIRRAKLMDRILSCKTIYLDEFPLAGTVGKARNYGYVYPEFSSEWMRPQGTAATFGTDREAAGNTAEDVKLLNEVCDYWKDRNQVSISRKMYNASHPGEPDVNTIFKASTFDSVATTVGEYPVALAMTDYDMVLNVGLKSLIADAEVHLRALDPSMMMLDPEIRSKMDFYQSVIITLQAVIKFAHRYADLAKETAKTETDPERRQELLRIAEACAWVPENKPRTFFEAVQSFWLLQVVALIEEEGCGIAPQHFSQYMYPFYKKDLDAGLITREQAIELLEFLFLKHKETSFLMRVESVKGNAGQTSKYFSLGGVTATGEDATNELDFLLLETQCRVRLPEPGISVFYHNKMSDEFLHACVKLVRTGIGQPQFFNNEVAVQRELSNNGCTMAEARKVASSFCASTALAGLSGFAYGGALSLIKVLEYTFHNGRDPVDGVQIGPKTGEVESLTTWEEFYEAYRKQLSFFLTRQRELNLIEIANIGQIVPAPFRSAMHKSCMEKGRDTYNNGSKYYTGGPLLTAGTNTGNSLTAVKKVVYDDKKISLKQLKDALTANFVGFEDIQKMCMAAPKHGNNDEYVDKVTQQMWATAIDEFDKVKGNPKGSRPEPYSIALHSAFGYGTGATPDGRYAGTSLTDASVSATPGTDLSGPTALVNSAADAMDVTRYGCNHFNVRFHPSALAGVTGERNLLSLIKTYMDRGGSHIQFNCTSTETLRDAQVHPENYKDLVVRVAGFSAFWVHLDGQIQDELISRTELTFS